LSHNNEAEEVMAIQRGTRDKGLQATLFDSTLIREAQEAMEFLTNVIEASTEYSIIGKDIDGKILLWNEGARRMYGYTAEEVVGKANSDILHTPEDVALGIPRQFMDAAMYDGKWEGVIGRVRKDGKRITARVVGKYVHGDNSGE
jgi:PAS domain S-box-containing protein